MHKSRGRRWQRAARGACLRASAIAGAAGLGGAMRANGAPTRPQAASGGMGAERPMRARGDGGRRGAGCAVRKRSAAQRSAAQRLPIERPLPPLWDTLFLPGAKPERGMGGVSEASGGGRGSGPPSPRADRGAALRARYRVSNRVGGMGAVAARQVGPRQETSISSHLASIGGPAGRLSLPRYGARMAYPLPASRWAALIGTQTRTKRAGIGPRIAWADFSDQI